MVGMMMRGEMTGMRMIRTIRVRILFPTIFLFPFFLQTFPFFIAFFLPALSLSAFFLRTPFLGKVVASDL